MNKSALYKLSYGLYVISSLSGDKLNGQIANTAFQVTSEPPTIAISINKQNLTHDFIKESGKFSVSMLSVSAPMEFIGRFGFKCGRETDKFDCINYQTGQTGVPVVTDHCVAFIEAQVIKELDCGTHRIFLGEIKNCDIINDEEPMTYAYYHLVKGGKSPKNAPTYQAQEPKAKKQDDKAKRYTCSVCGYVYDPETGDPDNGIKPGTKFDDLPDDWVCPVCGADKSSFSPE